MIATAKTPASRLAALLIPDAAPERSVGTAFITAVVSGETITAMPTAKRIAETDLPL